MAEILASFTPPHAASTRMTRSAAVSWVPLALLASLLALLYASLFVPIETTWRTDPNYSHGYLVPFICLGLVIRAKNRAGSPGRENFPGALTSLIPGGLLLLLATIVPWPLLTYASLALVFRGVVVAIGGRTWANFFTAPILFGFFMFPVPVTWTSYMALWLQDVVSRVASGLIEPFVICWRTGTVLHLAGVSQPLNVGEECSGLRQLVAFLAFAVLLGLLLDRPTWWRVLLVVLAIPFAVLANVARVLLMCYGAVHYGTGWMQGWLHHAPAAFTIPVGFGLLIAVDYILARFASRAAFPAPEAKPIGENPLVAETAISEHVPTSDNTPGSDSAKSLEFHGTGPSDLSNRPEGLSQNATEGSADLSQRETPPREGRRLRPLLICVGIGLVGQLALKMHLQASGAASFPALGASLAELPLQFPPAWAGQEHEDLADLRSRLPFVPDDLLLRDYRWQGNSPVLQVYAVSSRKGEDRRHHPEICIREVAGAPEDLTARVKISLDPEQKRQVQRFTFRTGTTGRTTVYYWHYTLFAPNRGSSFIQRLHQRLGQAPPSLTVQVSTSAMDQRELKLIEGSILPALDAAFVERFLPESAVIDSTRLPIALVRD